MGKLSEFIVEKVFRRTFDKKKNDFLFSFKKNKTINIILYRDNDR